MICNAPQLFVYLSKPNKEARMKQHLLSFSAQPFLHSTRSARSKAAANTGTCKQQNDYDYDSGIGRPIETFRGG